MHGIGGIPLVSMGGAVMGAPPWWMAAGVTPVVAYQAKGAASLAASYVNLVNPGTYDLTLGSAPDWNASDGWVVTSGAGMHLKTGVVPAQGYSMIVRFTAAAVGLKAVAGIGANGFTFGILPNIGDGNIYWGYGGAVVGGAQTAAGVLAATPSAFFVDGVSVATHSQTIPGGQTDDVWLFCTNNGGVFGTGWGGNVQAVAIYPGSIAAGIVALTAAMAAL